MTQVLEEQRHAGELRSILSAIASMLWYSTGDPDVKLPGAARRHELMVLERKLVVP
jgi:hypothetical protein